MARSMYPDMHRIMVCETLNDLRRFDHLCILEGSQSSFRARKPSEIRGRTRLEPQHEDNNEDSDSYVPDRQDDEYQIEEDGEGDGYPFPRYRRRSGEFHFQTHTPRYYGRSQTPPRGVLPTQPPQLQGQIRTQSSMEVLRGLAHPHPQAQAQSYKDSPHQSYHQHSDLNFHPDPYPRPHARPHVQDRGRDIYSSRSSHSSSLPSISSSPSRPQIEPSPIQRDYVLIQPQTQLSVPVLKQSFLQQTQMQLQQSQSQPQVQAQAQTSHAVSYKSTQDQGLSIHSSTTTTTTTTTVLPPVPTSISTAPSVSLLASSSAMPIPPSSAPVSAPASSLSNKHDHPPPPPSSSSSASLLSKKIVKTLKPDKPGEPVKRSSWEYVDLEEDDDELVSVSVSEGSSSVGGIIGVGVVSGDSGLSVESGTSFGLGHLFPIAQQAQSTKHASMNQQQRRQLHLQYQQSDVHTRLHVEPDTDGSEDGGGRTITDGGANVLISTVPADSSITISTTAIIDDSQPHSNENPHSISRPISPSTPNSSSSLNLDSNSNLKFDTRTNNHPKHTHTQSHYSHSGFHSSSHVAHMEDATESELDLNLDDDSDCDVGVSRVRVGGAGGDALLPSLGYLDEALSFIAEERARWSAAREGGAVGAGGSGSGNENAGVDIGFVKAEGKKTENRKVLGKFPFHFLRYVSWIWLCGVRDNAWWSFTFLGFYT